jgi:hypothetical protein
MVEVPVGCTTAMYRPSREATTFGMPHAVTVVGSGGGHVLSK